MLVRRCVLRCEFIQEVYSYMEGVWLYRKCALVQDG